MESIECMGRFFYRRPSAVVNIEVQGGLLFSVEDIYDQFDVFVSCHIGKGDFLVGLLEDSLERSRRTVFPKKYELKVMCFGVGIVMPYKF